MISRIEKYGLVDRLLELYAQGHTSTDIARILSQELPSGITIGQTAVSRHLKNIRKARTEQTREIYEDHIKTVLPTDLKALESFENLLFDWVHDEALPKPERARYGMDMTKVIDTKLKYSGLLEDPSKTPGVAHPVDLKEYLTDEKDSEDSEDDDDQIQTH